MKFPFLFLTLSCLTTLADHAPDPSGCSMEFNSFDIDTQSPKNTPYCKLVLDGTYGEEMVIISNSIPKKKLSGFSVMDSTGKIYQLDSIQIYPSVEIPKKQPRRFLFHFICLEWPSEQAEWLHFRGTIPIICARVSYLNPVEVDLLQPGKIEIPLLGDDIPVGDIADPSLLVKLSLSVKKQRDEGENDIRWIFSLKYPSSFRFRGLMLEDMQGRPAPIKAHMSSGILSGGGGTAATEYYTLPRSCEKIRIWASYVDPHNFETRKIPLDIKVGMGGIIPQEKTVSIK